MLGSSANRSEIFGTNRGNSISQIVDGESVLLVEAGMGCKICGANRGHSNSQRQSSSPEEAVSLKNTNSLPLSRALEPNVLEVLLQPNAAKLTERV